MLSRTIALGLIALLLSACAQQPTLTSALPSIPSAAQQPTLSAIPQPIQRVVDNDVGDNDTDLSTPAPVVTSTQYVDYWTIFEPNHRIATRIARPVAAKPTQAGNLWERLGANLKLSDVSHPRLEQTIAKTARNTRLINLLSQRARPYLYHIVQEAERRNIPMELALIPMVESSFDPMAVSPGKAAGLWQFRSPTGDELGLERNYWYDGRHDIHASTQAAFDYLSFLNKQFDGDWLLAIAAYNAGWGRVQNIIKANRRAGKPTDFWSLPLPPITRAYIPKVLALARIVANPSAYGVKLNPIPDRPYLRRLELSPDVSPSTIASSIGISQEEFFQYNPGFRRNATPPRKTHHILLPVDKTANLQSEASLFAIAPHEHHDGLWTVALADAPTDNRLAFLIDSAEQALAEVDVTPPPVKRPTPPADVTVALLGYRYTVRAGDTLANVAERYGIMATELALSNGLEPGDDLASGRTIIIETGSDTQTASNTGELVQGLAYEVKPGDSLWALSERFQVSVADLRRWNALPDWLHHPDPGKIIVVSLDTPPTQG